MKPKHQKNSISDASDTVSVSSKVKNGSVSSFTTSSTEDPSGKKCVICGKSFILRRKVTCNICLNVFCSDHCTRKRQIAPSDDLISICDNCDQEETKRQIIEEIDLEISKYSKELKELREQNEKLFREHFNKATMVNDLEMEITKQEWNQKKTEQDLMGTFESEQSKGNKLRNLNDQLRNTLEELNKSEREMGDQCTDTEFQIDSMKAEVNLLMQQKEEVSYSIEKVNQRLKESLAVDEVRKILCQKCLEIVNANFEKIDPSSENIVETIKVYHRESLMSSEPVKAKCILY